MQQDHARNPSMPRVGSGESATLAIYGYDQMDPEVRSQILSNIRVIYEPTIACDVHIATCRSIDGTYMAFVVLHAKMLKRGVWNPNLLAGDPRPNRSMALVSLLEASEDRIRELLVKRNGDKQLKRKPLENTTPNASPNRATGYATPPGDSASENMSLDYSVKPQEPQKSFLPWKRKPVMVRSDSSYTRNG